MLAVVCILFFSRGRETINRHTLDRNMSFHKSYTAYLPVIIIKKKLIGVVRNTGKEDTERFRGEAENSLVGKL